MPTPKVPPGTLHALRAFKQLDQTCLLLRKSAQNRSGQNALLLKE
jgi:hypothetical protein